MPHKTLVAIGCLTAIAITALIKEIDTWILISCVGAISGLGGFALGRVKALKKNG